MSRWLRSLPAAALVAVGAAWSVGPAALADQPTPMVRGSHVSAFVRFGAAGTPGASISTSASCSTPGGGNYKVNCHGTGRPVNETWIATNGPTYVAGANDYNSYNGQGQDGYYWSTDAKTWNDAGPIDVFPHNTNNAAGDPGLAIDLSGVVYYSSLFFNFHNCNVGGVELLRRDPSGAWTYTQIASNSRNSFQDKPAIAIDSTHVWESWTQFGSCTGVNVTSPIKVAIFPTGSGSVGPTTILSVPGSTYSQGSSIKADGSGGFWIAWEEYPSASATVGAIKLAHYSGTSWNTKVRTISPRTFTDLPSPLPGFSFRDNSFPALGVVSGSPRVVWTSYDSSVGRAYLWSGTTASAIDNSGGSQFFPSISPDGSGGVYIAFSQVNGSNNSYDQWLVHSATITKVSTASSFPNQDAFFSGQFIGDYNGLIGNHPIWTDIRGPDPNYATLEMDGMVSA